jgi:putative FmdB family regulatory protein
MSKIKTKAYWHKCKGCGKMFTVEAKITQKTKEVKCPQCGLHENKKLK